jgi:hypothetical protein
MLHLAIYLFLEGFGESSVFPFGCGLLGCWPCGASLSVTLRPAVLSDDFAPWRRLLIRDSELSIGIAVNVVVPLVVLSQAWRNRSQPKKQSNQSCHER